MLSHSSHMSWLTLFCVRGGGRGSGSSMSVDARPAATRVAAAARPATTVVVRRMMKGLSRLCARLPVMVVVVCWWCVVVSLQGYSNLFLADSMLKFLTEVGTMRRIQTKDKQQWKIEIDNCWTSRRPKWRKRTAESVDQQTVETKRIKSQLKSQNGGRIARHPSSNRTQLDTTDSWFRGPAHG